MGGTGLTEHLRYVYGPLEGRTARCTVQVENGRKLRWNLVDSRDLPNFAGWLNWPITIFRARHRKSPLARLALAPWRPLSRTYDQFGASFRRQPRRYLGGDFLCVFLCVLWSYLLYILFCVLRLYWSNYGGCAQVVLFFKVPPVSNYSTCCANCVPTRLVQQLRIYAFNAPTTAYASLH